MQGQQAELEVMVVCEAISLTLHYLDLVVDTLHHGSSNPPVIPGQDALPVLEH